MTETVRKWIERNFTLPACRDRANLVARTFYHAGYRAALQDQKALVFDGRRMVITDQANELADAAFATYMERETE